MERINIVGVIHANVEIAKGRRGAGAPVKRLAGSSSTSEPVPVEIAHRFHQIGCQASKRRFRL